MYVSTTSIYKTWNVFYKPNYYFKWHIRKTIVDWRRNHVEEFRRKNNAPSSVRRTFKEDYIAFKDRRGQCTVYVRIIWGYDNDTNVWEFEVVVPEYEIEWGRIKTVYTNTRGIYPLTILEDVEQVDKLPREEWAEITPDEKFNDYWNKWWRDSNIYVALGWVNAEHNTNISNSEYINERNEKANMTWTWKPIANQYNYWYSYSDWNVSAIQKAPFIS